MSDYKPPSGNGYFLSTSSIASLIVLGLMVFKIVNYGKPMDNLSLSLICLMYVFPFLLYFYVGSDWLDMYMTTNSNLNSWPLREKVVRALVLTTIGLCFSFSESIASIVKQFLFLDVNFDFYYDLVFLCFSSLIFYFIWHIGILTYNKREIRELSRKFRRNDFIFSFLSIVLLFILYIFLKWPQAKNILERISGGSLPITYLFVGSIILCIYAYFCWWIYKLAKPSSSSIKLSSQ